MGIRTKLFLWMGLVLLILAMFMLFFPGAFIRGDLLKSSSGVRAILHADQTERQQIERDWVEREVIQILQQIRELLLLVDKNRKNASESASEAFAYNPALHFLQVHDPEKKTGYQLIKKGEETLSREPLFSDVSYYQAFAPPEGAPPLAEAYALIDAESVLFLGNTARIGSTYVTLGSQIDSLLKFLAKQLHRDLFLVVNGVWKGFSQEGNAFSSEETARFASQKPLEFSQGKITVGEELFIFNKLSLLPQEGFYIYILTPAKEETAPFENLLALEQNLKGKITLQMVAIFLVCLLFSLAALDRIAGHITKPLIQLAHATEEVSKGQYASYEMPDLGHRKDEIATLVKGFEEMVKGFLEKEKIRAVLNKVVSKDVADEILKSTIHLGGEDRVVTILFSDIRGFTKMTADLSPQKTIEMLNSYMTKMFRVIEGEGGVIDKYVGDEIMALYGAPITHPDHAVRALSAAKLMIETLKKWNQERELKGDPSMTMGIGIHTGLVVAGNMGAEDRLNYTVLGANVNLASRLCQAAGPMQIIISEHTLQEPGVKDSFYTSPLESILPKGFSEPIKIYEITGFKWE